MSSDPQLPCVLFVDDEPYVVSALKRLFRAQDYRILTAGSGREALELLAQEPVDLVISDMRMPEMDGATLLEAIRQRQPQVMRILLTGHTDMATTIAAINRGEIYRYISKPWNDDDLLLTVRDALEKKRLEAENFRLNELARRQNEELKLLNASLEQKVADRTAQLRQALTSIEQAHLKLKKEFLTSVTVFSGLIELRWGHLGQGLAGHGRRVANLARILAQRLGLDESTTQDVMLAGLLHDIGKIGLPDSLIEKPFSSLAADARAQMMKHPAMGQNVLMSIDGLKEVATLIRHHHEHYDGSGYPDELTGPGIPLGARILAVVNDYDALQLGTLTLRALKPDEALAYLISNRGKRYDGDVVDALSTWLATQERESMADIPLHPGDLKSGMVLARDLTHRDGYLLLTSGHTLDAHLIERLVMVEEMDRHPLTLHVRTDSIPLTRHAEQ